MGQHHSTTSPIFFKNGHITLKNVIKLPSKEANSSLASLVENDKIKSDSYLNEMIFPKENIANINVRSRNKTERTDIKLYV